MHANLFVHKIVIDGLLFTKEYIEMLRELNDCKINGYLDVIKQVCRRLIKKNRGIIVKMPDCSLQYLECSSILQYSC